MRDMHMMMHSYATGGEPRDVRELVEFSAQDGTRPRAHPSIASEALLTWCSSSGGPIHSCHAELPMLNLALSLS